MSKKTRDGANGDNPDENDNVEIESIGDAEITPLRPEAATGDSAALEAQLKKAKEDYLYLLAEFDNYKKNAIRERSDLVKYGSERIIRELLEVMDNFERALGLEVGPDTVASFREGIVMTAGEMRRVFERFGVKEVDCQGQPFDPAIHEALSSEETDSVKPGHITRVFKPAYKMHERVIRPAQVVVAREPSKSDGGK